MDLPFPGPARRHRPAALAALALALAACTHPPAETRPVVTTGVVAADTVRTPPGAPTVPAGALPPPLDREFRGAWISPVEQGEWPSRPGLPSEQQRAELTALLDRARDVGLNAVVFHVRPGADAMYPTSRAPWSAYLTGKLGRPPSPMYDPVAFAVSEAHQRGLQLHAWFNPFRISPPMAAARHTRGAIATDHPKWVVRYGSQLWIDPGIPEARRAVLDAILEVVDRYDIDAVHLDDYFYPYLEERAIRRRVRRGRHWRRITVHVTMRFPDEASWRKYGRARGWTDRADWRRANIDAFVRELYAEVKARKPWVEVGISPFGIWRPGYPAGITGLDAYGEIFADSRRWLREGWLDYIAPQLYWPLDGDQHRFTRLDAWWHEQNRRGRHVWPGLFTAQAGSWGRWPPREIEAEIDTLRALRRGSGESLGHIHFRLKSLLEGAPGGVGDLLRDDAYRDAAVPPASPWLGATAPAAPALTLVTGPVTVADVLGRIEGKAPPAVDLAPGDSVPVRWWVVQLRDSGGRWTTTIHPAGDTRLTLAIPGGGAPSAAAVRALSRTGISSAPALVPLGAGP